VPSRGTVGRIPTIRELLYDDLVARYPKDLIDSGLDAYVIAKNAALTNDLRKAEMHFGMFCEAAIRICRNEVAPPCTPIGDSTFKVDLEIRACLNSAKGPSDSFRLLLPNTVRAMYDIRNRRGVDHLSNIKPNHIDARVLTAQADWILAELFRLATRHDFAHAQRLVDALVERQLPLIERINGEWKLLKTTMNTEIATLVVLYHDEEVSQAELAKIVKRSQPTISNAVKKLDAEGFIHKSGKALFITSLGRKRVETVSAVFAA
jgi:hypothetical protein